MKTIFFALFTIFSTVFFAQEEKSTKMGNFKAEELEMSVYEKNSSATALVLYEHANVYLDTDNDYKIRTDYYTRTKKLS